jgi:hypothetical protein
LVIFSELLLDVLFEIFKLVFVVLLKLLALLARANIALGSCQASVGRR